jgi:uncharacterized peroxidase-related enzyme
MPYIPLEDHLPGITGLLEYRRDSAEPIRELTQILLRGPSTLETWERELIAATVSKRNECQFCMNAHTAVTNLLLTEFVPGNNPNTENLRAPVSDKLKALLIIAGEVQTGGKNVKKETVDRAKEAGATDLEIHDTVLIAALFCLYNRYVDGLATVAPADPEFYNGLAKRIAVSYNRNPNGYDHLKKK